MFSRTIKQSVQYDMHTHSNISQESKIPGRLLLSLAKQNGLEGLGICEQDAFPDEALYAHAAKLRLKLALGTEFSCIDSHIIGFGMKYSSTEKRFFGRYFADIRRQAGQVARLLVDRLKEWDSVITFDKVAAFAGKQPHMTIEIGRAHV